VRILHWLNAYLPEVGGIQTLCAQLLPLQIARGHDVLMLTAHGRQSMPDRTMQGPFEVCRVDGIHSVAARDPGRVLRAKLAIGRILDEFSPQVIHFHPTGPETLHYLQHDRRLHRPTVVTVHNNYAEAGVDLSSSSSFGAVLDCADQVAAVSNDARRWICEQRPELAGRVSTVWNGVPVTEAAPTPLPWNPPRIAYIGRITVEKRVDLLLDAFARVAARHPEVVLSIAGDGLPSVVRQLEGRVTSLGLDDRVTFHGRLDSGEVPPLLEEATLQVLCSTREGLPMILLEAARQGRPSLVTDVGGCKEMVLDGETGIVVPAEDVGALAEAMAAMLTDRHRTERMAAAAARRLRDEFSLERCADRYDLLYLKALETARPRRVQA